MYRSISWIPTYIRPIAPEVVYILLIKEVSVNYIHEFGTAMPTFVMPGIIH